MTVKKNPNTHNRNATTVKAITPSDKDFFYQQF